jgi:hypothetical protein
LTEQLYGKDPKDLTASEKETISALSQVVGALSAVAVADNSSDGYRGAEVAKSAVENNFLGKAERAELRRLSEKEILTIEEAIKAKYFFDKNAHSEKLLKQYQDNPDSLTFTQQQELFTYLGHYGIAPEQIVRLQKPAYSPEMTLDYRDFKARVDNVIAQNNLPHIRIGDGITTGIATLGATKGAQLIPGSTKVVLGISGVSSVAGQYYFDGKIDPLKVMVDLGTSYATKNSQLLGTVVGGALNGMAYSAIDGDSLTKGAALGVTTGALGYGTFKGTYNLINESVNPIYKEIWVPVSQDLPFIMRSTKNDSKAVFAGSLLGELSNKTSSGVAGEVIDNLKNKGGNNE